jgi:hypothetical protein
MYTCICVCNYFTSDYIYVLFSFLFNDADSVESNTDGDRMSNCFGSDGEMRNGWEKKSPRRKSAQVPLCLPQLPYYLGSNLGHSSGK